MSRFTDSFTNSIRGFIDAIVEEFGPRKPVARAIPDAPKAPKGPAGDSGAARPIDSPAARVGALESAIAALEDWDYTVSMDILGRMIDEIKGRHTFDPYRGALVDWQGNEVTVQPVCRFISLSEAAIASKYDRSEP